MYEFAASGCKAWQPTPRCGTRASMLVRIQARTHGQVAHRVGQLLEGLQSLLPGLGGRLQQLGGGVRASALAAAQVAVPVVLDRVVGPANVPGNGRPLVAQVLQARHCRLRLPIGLWARVCALGECSWWRLCMHGLGSSLQ